MNIPRSPRGGLRSLAIMAILATSATIHASSIGDVPRGTLSVDRDLVRVGVHSQLEWNITYPAPPEAPPIDDLVEIIPPNRIQPKKNLRMKVRVLGVAFQSGRTLLPLDAYWSKNDGPWTSLFYGTGPTVVPDFVTVNEKVKKKDIIDFGARGWANGWLPFHHSRTADPYMTVLKNGESAPSYAPAYDQGTVASFLGPYIDAGGRVKIGERDLIILWEASAAAPGTTYFDMQDLVLLVTFE